MINDQEGAPLGTFEDTGTAADLLAAFARSEERFMAVVAGAPDPVAVISDGRFTLLNQRLVDLLGFGDPALLRNSPVLQRIHPDDRAGFAETTRLLLEGAAEAVLAPRTLRLIAADGRDVHVSVTAVRVDDETGPALYATLRDLTEHRQLSARLARSDRMASLGTLAAGVAHEINNPLGFILMNLDGVLEDLPGLMRNLQVMRVVLADRIGALQAERLLTSVGLPATTEPVDELTERTRDAYVGAQRVRDIVRDLRTFSNIETEDATLGPVQVESALEVALNLACHHIKYKARIRRDLSETPRAQAEEGRLSQVLLNLLVNAAQAPDGPDAKQVLLRSYLREDQVVVEVSDNGAGIAAGDLSRVFDPFFTTKCAGEGSGLGLAISREIVRSFGGDLECESTPGQGATFRVCLPIADESDAVLEQREEPTEETPGPRRPRILVVDDEPMMLRALERRLAREYDVTSAASGTQALERLSEEVEWDMVLCDVVMPGVDGAAVYHWIQTHRPQLLERTIMMTGGAVTSESQRFLDETHNLVLPKPLQVSQLLGVLRGMLFEPGQGKRGVARP
jgi:two-component system, cell cycle sensor histidine kinase and response regulator CckA